MILIPQLYLRGGKVKALERTSALLYNEDPLIMAQRIKEASCDSLYIIDLGIDKSGSGENVSVVKSIMEKFQFNIYVGDNFRTIQSIQAYISLGVKKIVLETVAYQEPSLVKEACSRFPENIAVKVYVNNGKVNIPGWAVSPNKTEYDYVDQFSEMGVNTFFYSDVGASGQLELQNFKNILSFCKKVRKNIICSSEINNTKDIEALVTIGAPGLDGIVLAHSLYEGRVDLKAATDLISDLSVAPGNEPTLLED
ncbi:MAG: hypothetical protein COS89_01420 [Deltaproteobacteria bacterium CG07_land_8_20_14_0_80_38_7]|nr:MAG: hypothetical protein COS89_01420 [Deltaproteobacteria bacterium CG07_land_8_20_14_0_80_38_7]